MFRRQRQDSPSTRRGFTLMEVVIVLTIMGILIALPAPMFLRAIEQSKLDAAAANLRHLERPRGSIGWTTAPTATSTN